VDILVARMTVTFNTCNPTRDELPKEAEQNLSARIFLSCKSNSVNGTLNFPRPYVRYPCFLRACSSEFLRSANFGIRLSIVDHISVEICCSPTGIQLGAM